ncbi:MAG: PDZ domain-containing protein [Anaerolineae bacterium]|nr:MAG: PDZ domain-containing protein [Anaerolineae bacterium]
MRSPRKHMLLAAAAALLLACQTVMGGLPATPTPTATSQTAPTLPPTATDSGLQPVATVAPTPTVETYDLPREQQQAIFQELWEIIRDEYLYPDFNGLDWDAIHVEYSDRIAAGLSDQAFYFAMDEMIFRLGDEHSVFLSPEMVAAEEAAYAGSLDYVGIGIYLGGVPERQRAVIYMVIPGSPAEAAGLKARDSILTVNGEPVLDELGYPTDTLRGPEGTDVTIEVQTPGEAPREITITRRRITGGLPVPYEVLTSPDGQRIGYLLIPTFSDGNIDKLVNDALLAMTANGPLDGLIVDDRLNDGGFDTELRGTLRLFTDGIVGYFVNRQGREHLNVNARDVGGSQTVPLVVLVGPETYSYGEVFAGVLADQGRATIIGETTEGNVETLWGFDFEDGSRAWIAHDTFEPANHPDADWEATGIVPDILAPSEWDLHTQADDPGILAALAFFDGQ